jgi:hypothetical protein
MNVLIYHLFRVFGHANYDTAELDSAAAAQMLAALPAGAGRSPDKGETIWKGLVRLPSAMGPCLHVRVEEEHIHDHGCRRTMDGCGCCHAFDRNERAQKCADCGSALVQDDRSVQRTVVRVTGKPVPGPYWQ